MWRVQLTLITANMDGHAAPEQLKIIVEERQGAHKRVHFEASLVAVSVGKLLDQTLG